MIRCERLRTAWRLALPLFAAGAALCLLLSCDPLPRSVQEEVLVALLVPEGGEMSGLDKEYRNAAELMRREVGRQGGIPTLRGRAALRVEMLTHGPGVEDALRAMRQALASGVAAIIGGATSCQALPMAALAESRGVPFVSPGATIARFTEGRRFVFRTPYSDVFQAQAAARLCRDMGAERAAVLYDLGNDYSSALASAFQKSFTDLGGQPPAMAGYADMRQEAGAAMRSLLRSRPQLLFLPVYHTVAPDLVRLARSLGFRGDLAGPDGWDLMREDDMADMQGARFLVPWHPGAPQTERSRRFVEDYTAAFGKRPSSVSALVYDAFALVFHATGRAQTQGPEALAAALGEVREFSGVAGTGRFHLGTPVRDAQILEVTSQGILFAGTIPSAREGKP